LISIENWSPISFPEVQEVRHFPKENIVSIGPMCLRLVITPHFIILPQVVYERIDWYSPFNKEIVNTLRSYYFTIIKHFGGDHALYVDERIESKYCTEIIKKSSSVLQTFEETLTARYGIKKNLYIVLIMENIRNITSTLSQICIKKSFI
jgi:hypothetical protein